MSDNNNQILIADDSKVIRRAAIKILQKEFEVIEAEDGQDAWDELQRNPNISAVFTDLGMPNMDGFELLKTIREADDAAIAKMPVVVITGAEETDGTKEKVLELGATDFITKPFDSAALKSRAAAHINYRKEVQSLEKQIAHDKLTGLLTEASFMEQGEKALAYARRHCSELTVVRFDIDRFSDVFVKYGKGVGEQILSKVANFIDDAKRTEDTAARLGVSRFAMVLTCTDTEGAETVVQRICERVAKLKLKLGDEVFHIRFSTGVTNPAIEDSEISFETLLKQAEEALRQAVQNADGKVVRYGGSKQASIEPAQSADVEVNLETLVEQLAREDNSVSHEQLASAMRKVLPLIAQADSHLKLGLSKVILHLKKKLH